ncbi:MAG TPA: peptidoglycan editing factor PgeF [Ktedonobacterales bacterium]|nr:peptidoglycan editing factor PgeF [Ktedonobacterales bacterium]
MIESRTAACEMLRFERLADVPGLAHGVFTRRGGVSAAPYDGLNASASTGDQPAAVQQNKARIAAALGLPLTGARCVHAATVIEVRPEGADDAWRARLRFREADAMMTDVPGFALFWSFGDCAPIVLYDPAHRAIALVHAGWRGTARAIARQAVRAMRARYGTRPGDLLAGVGPAIGSCCYEVSAAVRDQFRAMPEAWEAAAFAERANGDGAPRLYLDVRESNERQLLAAGLAPEHVETSGFCTGCRTDLFFSHRMERGGTGRFGVGVGLVA